MKLAIQIDGHPASSRAANTAYQFIKAALAKNHRIILVFFYYDGAFNGMDLSSAGTDEMGAAPQWAALARDHGIDLVICGAAADRRGIGMRSPSGAESLPATTLAEGFRRGGLGQWVDACIRCDRFINFAA